MDEFDTLLAGRAQADTAPPVDEFEALLVRKPKAAAAGRPGEIPRGSPYKAPPAAEPGPNRGGVGEFAVDVGDIVLGGVPAMILGSVGEVTQRLSAVMDGRGYREGAKAGAEFSRFMGEQYGRPLFDAFSRAGLIDPKTKTLPMAAMDKVGGWLENAATIVERDSGGRISKEDYLASVNGFMAALGVKGVRAATQGALNRASARKSAGSWDAALERYNAEESLARAKHEEVTPERTAAKSVATPPAADRLYGGDFAAQAAARRAAYLSRKGYEKQLGDFPPSGERTGARDAVDLTLEGRETPTTREANQPFHTADTTQALKRGIVADTPIELEGKLAPAARPALDTGLEKVRDGRLFDMTTEERLAVRNAPEITDPKVITAAALGATGLGLAMAYEPSADEAALAIGAGALLRRGGKGETLRELAARPDSTPLGALLEPSAYTTSTLELLAKQSPGKFELRKSAVEQALRREGVTKHERDLMQEALASVPGDTITAKGLMVGLKTAAKDFELTPVKSTSYADYGLDRIDRVDRPEITYGDDILFKGESAAEATTRIYQSPLELGTNNHFQDPNYFAHTRSFTEDGIRHVVEMQSDLAQKAKASITPEARVRLTAEQVVWEDQIKALADNWGSYRYPSALDSVNVINALKKFRPEVEKEAGEYLQNRGLYEGMSPEKAYLEAKKLAFGEDVPYDNVRAAERQLQDIAGKFKTDLEVRRAELRAKLAESAGQPVAPMLKDWHKRLVREEIADAARQLEGSVRFATADTVAKVEGWRRLREVHEANAENYRRGSDEWAYHMKLAEGAGDKLQAEHQGIYDRYSRDVEPFLRKLGGKPYTDSAGHTWIEVPLGEQQKSLPGGGARTQIGGVDPKLLGGAAAVGGVAALAYTLSSKKERERHALWMGALTGLGLYAKSRSPAIAKMASDFAAGVQRLAGNLSTDSAMTAPVLRRLTNFEMDLGIAGHAATRRIAPFIEQLSQVPASLAPLVNTALHGGKTAELRAALGKHATPAMMKAWEETQALIRDLGVQGKAVGLLKGDLRPDHFPRMVKDLPGLLTAIGKTHRTELQFALSRATEKAGGVLDDGTRAEVVNRFLEKHLRQAEGGKSSFLKRRTIENVTVDLEPFYVEPLQTLPLYVDGMVRAIEKAKFFGKELVVDPESGRPNLEASIGAIVAKEDLAGRITPENYTRFAGLLRSRFVGGEQAPHRILQTLGQFTNIALLGNVFSAGMNLADLGGIGAQQQLGVVKALQKKLTGKSQLTLKDAGLADSLAAEFVYGTRDPVKMRLPFTQTDVQISMAKALDKTFKYSLFKQFDLVMKEVHLNAATERYQALSRTKAGEAKILRQYGDYFTTDMGQLLTDLRSGKKTRLTTELAFRELSDAQPITKIEMPQFYLDHPNLRFAFALKSFMIKQLNLVKKRGIDQILKGDAASIREGTGFLLRYTLLAGAAGASMDWIVKSLLGRNTDMEWGDVPLTALKNFGLSQYILDKVRQGKGKEAIASAFAPPLDPILNIASGDPEGVRNFPLVGRLFYDRAMDGAEKANAAKELAKRKDERAARRTPAEQRELDRRAAEKRKELAK